MPNQQSGSGQFTNIQRIIGANQNNQLGNTIQKGVSNDVNNLQNNVNQSQSQFNSLLGQNNFNTSDNQNYINSTISGITGTPNPQQQSTFTNSTPSTTSTTPSQSSSTTTQPSSSSSSSNTNSAQSTTPSTTTDNNNASSSGSAGSFGFSDPTSGANQTQQTANANDVAKFNQFEQGTYQGPTQLSNLSALAAQGQNLQNVGQNAATQGGLQSLLQQYVGGQNYTQGQQGLDSLILGQTGKSQLQNILQSTQNASSIPTQAEQQAEAAAGQAALGNQQLAQYTQQQLTAAENPVLQQIQNQLGNYQNLYSQIQGFQTQANAPPTTASTATQTPGGSMPTMSNGPALAPGQTQASQDTAAAMLALQNAANQGLISQSQYSTIQGLLPTINSKGLDLGTYLGQSFAPDASTAFNPSIQQAANSQQAAQLNALDQLAGNPSQFSTYGAQSLPINFSNIASLIDNAPGNSNISILAPPTDNDGAPTGPTGINGEGDAQTGGGTG